MQKILDYASWGFILLFAVPTILIMASWNSLPGEPMYGVKRSFEQTLLFFVKPSYAAEASLNVQFTQRRFNEAKVLLANNQSTEGISYLSQQIKATKTVIERAPDKTKQREIAQNYITTLRSVSQELAVQQQTLTEEQGSQVVVPTRTPMPTPTPRSLGLPQLPGSITLPTHAPTATPKPIVLPQKPTTVPIALPSGGNDDDGDDAEDINDIQAQINDTINDLELLSGQTEMGDDDDNGNNGNGNGNGNGNNSNGKGPWEKQEKKND